MRADARGNREAIVAAACTLFAEQGPEVSLRSVAAAADVGIATLYRHFPTRDDLLVGIAESIAGQALGVIRIYLGKWDDTHETWREFVHALADLRLASIAVQIVAHVDHDGPVWSATDDARAELFEAYEELLSRAADCGFVPRSLTPWRFHLGVGYVSRPVAGPAEDIATMLAPGLQDWVLDTFIDGLVESAGKRG